MHQAGINASASGPRVLYITYDGLTDPLGQSQVLPYLQGLAQKGARIVVLSCEKPAAFAKRNTTVAAQCAAHGIAWESTWYTKRPPVLSTVRDVLRLRRLATRLQRRQAFDIVHCRSYVASLVGDYMRKRFGTSFIFDMRGFWADERLDGKLWRLSNPIHRAVYRFFKRRERNFIESSDAIISLTEAAKHEMLKWELGLNEKKVTVIPCCADLDHFSFSRFNPSQRLKTRAALGITPDSLLLSYLGSTGTWYLVDEMLEYFKQLRQTRPEAQLLFITNDDGSALRRKAREMEIPDDQLIITSVSREQVPELLFAADLSYFFIAPAYSKLSSSPTKLAEILGMGKPVICNIGVGDLESIFADSNIGMALDVKDRAAWQRSIDSIDQLLGLDPTEIRQKALQHFSLERGVASYHCIYDSLVARSVTGRESC